MSAFSLPMPPRPLADAASQAYGTLRYHAPVEDQGIRGFGTRLEPRYIFAAGWLLDQ